MANIVKSLDIIQWTQEDRELGLPGHIRECVAAEYGNLSPERQRTEFRSSGNSNSVRFGQTDRLSFKQDRTPALALLSLCVQLDAIASAPHNVGLVIRVPEEDLPSVRPNKAPDSWIPIRQWIQERRAALLRKRNTTVPATA